MHSFASGSSFHSALSNTYMQFGWIKSVNEPFPDCLFLQMGSHRYHQLLSQNIVQQALPQDALYLESSTNGFARCKTATTYGAAFIVAYQTPDQIMDCHIALCMVVIPFEG